MKKLIVLVLSLFLISLIFNYSFSYDYPEKSIFKEPYQVKNSLALKIGLTAFVTGVTVWAYQDCKSFGINDTFLLIFGVLAVSILWIKF